MEIGEEEVEEEEATNKCMSSWCKLLFVVVIVV